MQSRILPFLVLCIGVAALAYSSTAFFSSKTVYVIDVSANQDWQDTSITLGQGKQAQVEYLSGKWTDYLDKVPLFGPAGEDSTCTSEGDCCEPLPKEHKGALIGQVGDKVFLIGDAKSFTAPAGGVLYLRMNDCSDALQDNAGLLRIKITP